MPVLSRIEAQLTDKLADATVIMQASSGSSSLTGNRRDASDSRKNDRQCGEHSSCANDSVVYSEDRLRPQL